MTSNTSFMHSTASYCYPSTGLTCCLLCRPLTPFPTLPTAGHKDRRYVVHAINRYAEIFLAYSNGTLVEKGLNSSRINLQSVMSVVAVTTTAKLVASEPVSYGRVGGGRVIWDLPGDGACGVWGVGCVVRGAKQGPEGLFVCLPSSFNWDRSGLHHQHPCLEGPWQHTHQPTAHDARDESDHQR